MDFQRRGKPRTKEMRTVRVMKRRLTPGLVFRMVWESNFEVESVIGVWGFSLVVFGSGGGESEISAMEA